MNKFKRMAPIAQLVLILPAALFMVSLILRGTTPMQYEPARIAQQIITWYSGRIWTLWILLTLLPLAVLSIGGIARLGQSGPEPHRLFGAIRSNRTMMLVAALTLVSALILLIVGAHVLMN